MDFIVDFVCLEHQLVVEVDGAYHFSGAMQLSDMERTAVLEGQGFRVIRFTNEEVLHDTENVTGKIMKYINQAYEAFHGTITPPWEGQGGGLK